MHAAFHIRFLRGANEKDMFHLKWPFPGSMWEDQGGGLFSWRANGGLHGRAWSQGHFWLMKFVFQIQSTKFFPAGWSLQKMATCVIPRSTLRPRDQKYWLGIHFTSKAGRKWKWSNGVKISEMGIVQCKSITNNVESYKHRKNCECCHHHSLFKGHNVIVHIVVDDINCSPEALLNIMKHTKSTNN